MARWKYVVTAVVVVPVGALTLFIGWVYVSFSGGLDDVLDFDHPSRTDPGVVEAEQRAVEQDLPEMNERVRAVITEAAPGLGRVGEGTARPLCDVGQHNFKIDDDFDLSCTATAISVVAAPTAADQGGTGTRVDAVLRSDGWEPVPSPRVGGGPTVMQGQDARPYRYTRTEDGRAWQLILDDADLSTITAELHGHAREGLRDASGQPVSLEEMVAGTPRDGYAVAVGLSVEYFRD